MDPAPAIVALTGAGISAESGIPTFRGPDGLWQGNNPQQLATPEAFDDNPELVWRFYEWRRGLVRSHKPNQAHELLVEIAEAIPLVIITQNVDGYHTTAGSKHVIELHGSLWGIKCTHCAHHWEDYQYPLMPIPPRCPCCDALARPDVVWFGESLDPRKLSEALTYSQKAKVFISIGTSSMVHPAAELPLIAQRSGAHTIEINPEQTPISEYMDEVIRDPASIGLYRWWKAFSPGLLNAN